jgi:threonine dehydrogenase-like Zn-dependent dehydrogenase
MRGLFVGAEWAPTGGYEPPEHERATQKTKQSSKVWKNPVLSLREDLPEPSPGPGEVKIQVKACGVCGSDLLVTRQNEYGYTSYSGYTKMNIVPGHEASGMVVEVGVGVKTLKPGDAVSIAEGVWCGECHACRTGFPNQCTNLDGMGVTRDGSYAEYVCAHEKVCWKLDKVQELLGKDDDAVYEYGALAQPSSVCYNAIFECGGGFRPGAYAAVFGGGPIGLLGAMLLKAGGAAKVIVFELQEYRAQLAKTLGADIVINPKALEQQGVSCSEALMELTNGYGADIILESAGVPHILMEEMLKSLAINGCIIEAAMCGTPSPVLLTALQFRKAQICGSLGDIGHGFFESVIRLMASGRYDPRPIITDRFALKDGLAAFERARGSNVGKVLICP